MADNLDAQAIYDLCRQVGFTPDQSVTMTAVAMAESGGNPHALAVASNEHSVGLFQINQMAHPGLTDAQLADPLTNAKMAYEVSHGGRDISPWTTTHLTGDTARYQQYESQAMAAAAAHGETATHAFFTGVAGYGDHHPADGFVGPASADDPSAHDPSHVFLQAALAQQGDAYHLGATPGLHDADPHTFDCSSLVQWSAAQAGIHLERTAEQQYLQLKSEGTTMSVEQALHTPGALLFHFPADPVTGQALGGSAHVAISLGDGRTIEAIGTQWGVREVDVKSFHTGGTSFFTNAAYVPGLVAHGSIDQLLAANDPLHPASSLAAAPAPAVVLPPPPPPAPLAGFWHGDTATQPVAADQLHAVDAAHPLATAPVDPLHPVATTAVDPHLLTGTGTVVVDPLHPQGFPPAGTVGTPPVAPVGTPPVAPVGTPPAGTVGTPPVAPVDPHAGTTPPAPVGTPPAPTPPAGVVAPLPPVGAGAAPAAPLVAVAPAAVAPPSIADATHALPALGAQAPAAVLLSAMPNVASAPAHANVALPALGLQPLHGVTLAGGAPAGVAPLGAVPAAAAHGTDLTAHAAGAIPTGAAGPAGLAAPPASQLPPIVQHAGDHAPNAAWASGAALAGESSLHALHPALPGSELILHPVTDHPLLANDPSHDNGLHGVSLEHHLGNADTGSSWATGAALPGESFLHPLGAGSALPGELTLHPLGDHGLTDHHLLHDHVDDGHGANDHLWNHGPH